MLAPGTGGADVVLAAFDVALADADAASTLAMSNAELHDYLVGLQSVRSRFDALMCSVTADADRAAVQTTTGHRSVASSVGSRTNVDSGVVAGDRLLGRWLGGYPLFADAFAAGVLTRRPVQLLRKVDNPRTRVALRHAQDYLIEAATTCGWKDFTKALAYWLLAADPDGAEPKQQVEDRKGSILTLADGTVKQTNYFDPITGGAVKSAVEAKAKALWTADAEAEKADPTFVVRTHRQRIADAAAELQIAGHDATSPAGSPPLVHIVMSERVAEDMMTRIADPDGVKAGDYPHIDPNQLPLDVHDIDGRCELADGTPIHPTMALAALATGTLRRLILGADSEVLDLGRSVRGFPRRLRQALIAKARGRCEFAGCDAPMAWLEADHVFPWSKGGPTSIANGEMLCGPHNRIKGNRAKGDRANPAPEPPQRE